MTLHGHDGWIRSVAFTPDGKHIVSSGDDSTIRVWDISTGENIMTLRGHEGSVSSAIISPNGKQIVSGSQDNTIKVWNIGAELESTRFVGHKEKSHPVAFSPDGRCIVSGSGDGMVKVWDVQSASEVMSFSAGGPIYPLCTTALSPDGKCIASVPTNWGKTTINIWNIITGDKIVTLRGHKALVTCLSFSPDKKWLASGSADKTIKVWNVTTGSEILTLKGHKQEILSVAFSPNGNLIASASYSFLPPALVNKEGESRVEGGEIKVWDSATGAHLISLQHDVFRSDVAFSPDSHKIVCGSKDGTIKVWDSTTGAELMVLRGHADAITSVAFSPDGKRIISGSWDNTVKLWDSTTGSELLILRDYDVVRRAIFSPDGRSIAAGTWAGTIVLWESTEQAAGHTPREAGRIARKLVDTLYQKDGYYYEVIRELQSGMTFDETVRKIALQIANAHKWEDAMKLRRESASVVNLPDRDIEAYGTALEKAQKANVYEPNDLLILYTLGIAQYRVGAYEQGLQTLKKADEIRVAVEEKPDVACITFTAMALHQLGRDQEAQTALTDLRKMFEDDRFRSNKEAHAFLAEAEKLIAGKKQ